MLNVKRRHVTSVIETTLRGPQGEPVAFINAVATVGESFYGIATFGMEDDPFQISYVDDVDYIDYLNLAKHLLCRQAGVSNLYKVEFPLLLARVVNTGSVLGFYERVKAGGRWDSLNEFNLQTYRHVAAEPRYQRENYTGQRYTGPARLPAVPASFPAWEASLAQVPAEQRDFINGLRLFKPF